MSNIVNRNIKVYFSPGFLKFLNQLLKKNQVLLEIRNLKQGSKFAKYISLLPIQSTNSPMMIEMAINELIINAIEHGLLKISYNEKEKLLKENNWDKYIAERLANLPKDQFITIQCKLDKKSNTIEVTITDPGKGFNPTQYTNKFKEDVSNKSSAPAQHGRGMMLAHNILGPNLKYVRD